MAGQFHDDLSGLKLDIFSNGESGVIPDCPDEKLEVVKKAIDCGILFLDGKKSDQGPQRVSIVDNSANTEKACAEMLLWDRKRLLAAIDIEKNPDRIKILETLERAGKARVAVLKKLQKRSRIVESMISSEKVEEEFEVTNITETKAKDTASDDKTDDSPAK